MKNLIACIFAASLAVAGCLALGHIAEAQGSGSAPSLDAGVKAAPAPTPAIAVGSASSSASAATAATPAPDVITAPKDAYDAEAGFYKQGGVLLAIVGALYLLAATLGRRAHGTGSWWDKGKLPVIYAAAASSLLALLGALTKTTTWPAAIMAIIAAGATVLSPDPKPAGAK